MQTPKNRPCLWAFALLVTLITGCWWDDEEDYPYIDPDALTCCRCIAEACPDGGPEDAGEDAGEDGGTDAQ